MSCTNTPNHGTMGTNGPFAIAITDTNGLTTSSYIAGGTYNIQLYSTGSTKFRGYIMAGFASSGTPSYSSTKRAGTMTPVSANMVVQTSCSGGVTQTDGSVDKTSVVSSWSAPTIAGTGSVVIYSVLTVTKNGKNYRIASFPLSETVGSTGSDTPTTSPTTSQSPSRTRTSSVSRSPTATITPTPSPSFSQTNLPPGASQSSTSTISDSPTPSISESASLSESPSISESLSSSVSISESAQPSQEPTASSVSSVSFVASNSPLPNSNFYPFLLPLSNGITIEWNIDQNNDRIHMRLSMVQPADQDKWTWFGIAFNTRNSMLGGDAITIEPGLPEGLQINRYNLNGYSSQTCLSSSEFLSFQPFHSLFGGDENLVTLSGMFSRPLSTNGTGIALHPSDDYNIYLTWAWGYETYGTMSSHTSFMSGYKRISLTRGDSLKGNMPLMLSHGILAIIGMLVSFPVTSYIHRYIRNGPVSNDKTEMVPVHKRSQMAYSQMGYLFSIVGFALGLLLNTTHFQSVHGKLGFATVLIFVTSGISTKYFKHLTLISSIGRFTAFSVGIVAIYYGIQSSGSYYEYNSSMTTTSGTSLFSILLSVCFGAFVVKEIYHQSNLRNVKQNNTPKIVLNPVASWAVRVKRQNDGIELPGQ